MEPVGLHERFSVRSFRLDMAKKRSRNFLFIIKKKNSISKFIQKGILAANLPFKIKMKHFQLLPVELDDRQSFQRFSQLDMAAHGKKKPFRLMKFEHRLRICMN